MQDIEKLAATGADIPPGLTMTQQWLFLSLRMLYIQFRTGAVNKDQAQREKREILDCYEKYQIWEQIYQKHLAIYNAGNSMLAKANKSDCEQCKEFSRVLTGLPPHKGNRRD